MTDEGHDGCVFCSISTERIIFGNELAYAIQDAFPVTRSHTLVIPNRHVGDFFDLTEEELLACNAILANLREGITTADPSVAGFNIGINTGLVAGQTIFHCHIHLIPRRAGDVDNPRGGIRHVIPGKGSY